MQTSTRCQNFELLRHVNYLMHCGSTFFSFPFFGGSVTCPIFLTVELGHLNKTAKCHGSNSREERGWGREDAVLSSSSHTNSVGTVSPLILTQLEQLVQTLCGLVDEHIPAPMVVALTRKAHHTHFVDEGVCANDVVTFLWMGLLHIDAPSCLSNTRQTNYHDHLHMNIAILATLVRN